ncbi:MAG: dihydropteroate synthase [Actinomycetota bacterium]
MRYKIRALDFSELGDADIAFKKIKVTPAGARIMAPKARPLALKIRNLSPVAVNILKQEALARGGDVATSRDSLIQKEGSLDAILVGTRPVIKSLIKKIRMQPFGLRKLAQELSDYIGSLEDRQAFLNLRGKRYDIGSGFWVMGILNVTPDSFYDGGMYFRKEAAEKRVEEMIEQGADIIDVGGMSTRPGSEPVSLEEEIKRTVPVVEHIKKSYGLLVSIDTYRSQVAEMALEAGADMVNDISALTFDRGMAEVVAASGAGVVLMHIKGTPKDMQANPSYGDVVEEVYDFLYSAAGNAVSAGIGASSIVVDPGIGFGKTARHNLKLIRKLKEFSLMGFPLLLGASRKSFIEKTLGLAAGQRLEPSIAVAVYGYLKGANMLRVHDVGQTKKALDMVKAIQDVE